MGDPETGKRLEIIKKYYGLSDRELGDIMGVTEDTAYNYRIAKTALKTPKAKMIAEYYGIDISWILAGVGAGPAGLDAISDAPPIVAELKTPYKAKAGRGSIANYQPSIQEQIASLFDDLPLSTYRGATKMIIIY